MTRTKLLSGNIESVTVEKSISKSLFQNRPQAALERYLRAKQTTYIGGRYV